MTSSSIPAAVCCVCVGQRIVFSSITLKKCLVDQHQGVHRVLEGHVGQIDVDLLLQVELGVIEEVDPGRLAQRLVDLAISVCWNFRMMGMLEAG